MKYRILLAPGVLILLLAGYMLWAKPFSYKPAQEALDIIGKSQSVQEIDLGWDGTYYVFFPDRSRVQRKGFVLYPGGLVDPRAYAPLMQALAAEGCLAVIVSMPLDLAVLGYTRAGLVMSRYPDIDKWVLGGHSLGGAMACRYVRSSAAKISGLILLASYPSHRFRVDDMTLKALSVFGTSDGLTDLREIEASKQHLPAGTQFVEIPGGNHSQFYAMSNKDDIYRGDKPASIPYAEQQQAILKAITVFLGSL